MVPIDMRGKDADRMGTEFGNRFSNAMFPFPLRYASPLSLVWDIKGIVDGIKNSPAPLVQYGVLSMIAPALVRCCTLGRQAYTNLGLLVYGKATVMLSNVPGPQRPLTIGGHTVNNIAFYAFAPIGCYLGIFTYNGQCNLGVVCDRSCELADAGSIAALWKPALDELLAALDAAGGKAPPPPPPRCV
jgi:diacylglycerol O-acyltransferase